MVVEIKHAKKAAAAKAAVVNDLSSYTISNSDEISSRERRQQSPTLETKTTMAATNTEENNT